MKTKTTRQSYPKLYLIKEEVEKLTGIDDIRIKARQRPFVMARWIYVKAAREFTDCSTASIGDAIHRDHSTVVHALNHMEFDFKYDTDLQNKYDELAIILTNKLHENAIESIDMRIESLRHYIKKLVKRRKQLINNELINAKQQNQKDLQVFWS
jgi:hypothetical protein